MNQSNSVSIHIRRGDITSADIDKPVMTIGYYKNAVSYIIEKIDSPRFFVFSDDIEWAKENLH